MSMMGNIWQSSAPGPWYPSKRNPALCSFTRLHANELETHWAPALSTRDHTKTELPTELQLYLSHNTATHADEKMRCDPHEGGPKPVEKRTQHIPRK